MTKQDKRTLIDSLSREFKSSSALVVCSYKGLSVKQLDILRSSVRKCKFRVQIIKNTLSKIALKEADYPDFELKEPNIFVWGEDQIELSKLVVNFAKSNKDFFSIKAGFFDRKIVEVEHIVTLSELPSRDELVGMLLSVWNAPLRYLATALENLRRQKEK